MKNNKPNPKVRLYQCLLLFIVVITSYAGLSVYNNQKNLLVQNMETHRDHVKYKFYKSLREKVALVERMALRWEHGVYSNEMNWRYDASTYIKDYPHFQSISYIKDNNVLWTEGDEVFPRRDIRTDEAMLQLLSQATNSQKTELSQPQLMADGMSYTNIVTPIIQEGKLTGHLLFFSNTSYFMVDFFSTVSIDVVAQVFFNQQLVYQSNDLSGQNLIHVFFDVNIDSDADSMKVYLYPSDHLMVGVQGYIPYVIWMGGLIVTLLFLLLMRTQKTLQLKASDLAEEIKQKQFIQRKLEHMAHYDELTRLPNLHRLLIKLNKQISLQKPLWLAVVDLGILKDISDTLGSQVTDEIIRDASRRLDYLCEGEDWLARMGGVVFALVFDGQQGEVKMTGKIKSVMSTLNRPFYNEEETIQMSPLMGITHFPELAADAQELIDQAKIALASARSNNKNYEHFSPNITKDSLNRVKLLTKIQAGIENKEFDMLYQTRFDIESEKICGAEGLIRWQQPNGTILSPKVFLDTLEESGLIVSVGWQVLSHALKQFVHAFGVDGATKLSFNFSGKQLDDPNFPMTLTQTLDQNDFPYQQFEVELTEQTLINNMAHNIAVLKAVRKSGITVAIDGFGSGFTSFSYLKNLPVDVIKIDKSLTQEHVLQSGEQQLLKTLIETGMNLGVRVVAEGINTKAQYQIVKSIGCHEAQGGFFSKPVSLQVFKEIVAAKAL